MSSEIIFGISMRGDVGFQQGDTWQSYTAAVKDARGKYGELYDAGKHLLVYCKNGSIRFAVKQESLIAKIWQRISEIGFGTTNILSEKFYAAVSKYMELPSDQPISGKDLQIKNTCFKAFHEAFQRKANTDLFGNAGLIARFEQLSPTALSAIRKVDKSQHEQIQEFFTQSGLSPFGREGVYQPDDVRQQWEDPKHIAQRIFQWNQSSDRAMPEVIRDCCVKVSDPTFCPNNRFAESVRDELQKLRNPSVPTPPVVPSQEQLESIIDNLEEPIKPPKMPPTPPPSRTDEPSTEMLTSQPVSINTDESTFVFSSRAAVVKEPSQQQELSKRQQILDILSGLGFETDGISEEVLQQLQSPEVFAKNIVELNAPEKLNRFREADFLDLNSFAKEVGELLFPKPRPAASRPLDSIHSSSRVDSTPKWVVEGINFLQMLGIDQKQVSLTDLGGFCDAVALKIVNLIKEEIKNNQDVIPPEGRRSANPGILEKLQWVSDKSQIKKMVVVALKNQIAFDPKNWMDQKQKEVGNYIQTNNFITPPTSNEA